MNRPATWLCYPEDRSISESLRIGAKLASLAGAA